MQLTVNSRSGKTLVKNIQVDGTSVADLKKAFHKKYPQYYPSRQRFSYNSKPLSEDSEDLAKYEISDGDIVIFKDLGPQISWKLVFVIEYFGPLAIHPLFYFFGSSIYGTLSQPDLVQRLALLLVLVHFLKRELETLFIHRFSNATMPFLNVFKNSFHYWILSGVLIAWDVYRPKSSSDVVELGTIAWDERKWWIIAGVALWVYGQISNFLTHVTLRNLRRPGTTTRRIPYGYGFTWVSCPNYFFETVAWAGFCLVTKSWAAVIFTIIAFIQMYLWAVKKHRKYRKDFKDYPKARKAIIPLIA